jgi:hypothetical protein
MPKRATLAFATLWVAACGSNAAKPGGEAAPDGGGDSGGEIAVGPSDAGALPDLGSPGATDARPPTPDAGPLPPDPCVDAGTCTPGSWINVTPSAMPASALRPTMNAFGPGSVVADPSRPSDLYVGPNAGLWKSTDYGSTWQLINTTLQDAPRGVIIAVAGTTPATIWSAGYNVLFKSTDGGKTFAQSSLKVSLYSLKVDPNDPTHLISGLHEADGIVESTDGGATWNSVAGAGFPSGGVSWYPYFIDTGDAAGTRKTWFAIAQNGASAITTTDGGAHWTMPAGVSGLQHPHGNSQIFQDGANLYVGGIAGPGQGVYRSPDRGVTWSRVDSGKYPEAIVWGTPTSVYAMYAWACSGCNLGTDYETAPPPGMTWSTGTVPAELTIGPNSVAVTFDGTHHVFVAVMWDQGIWRYVEP